MTHIVSQAPVKLVPYVVPLGNPPSYFIVAGLVFTTVTVPYLKSEYGKVRISGIQIFIQSTNVILFMKSPCWWWCRNMILMHPFASLRK